MPHSITNNLIRHISLRQLQIFEAVVRLGGYTRAAEALHLSQPTVSMQIKKLSDTIGLPLIEQAGRSCQPTAAGRDVYQTAQAIIGRLATLADSAAERQGVVKGELHIAVVTSAKYFMPRLLGAFVAKHPQVQPRLTVTNRAKVLARLKAHDDDLLIMGQVPGELAVRAHPLINNELVVAAPPDHPLAHRPHIALADLSDQRFLVREPGSGTRQAVDRLFADHGLTIAPYMELGSGEAIKQGVMAGLGISVLSRLGLRLELAGQHLVELDVDGFPLLRRWYAVHPRSETPSLVARRFLEFIINESDTILAG